MRYSNKKALTNDDTNKNVDNSVTSLWIQCAKRVTRRYSEQRRRCPVSCRNPAGRKIKGSAGIAIPSALH